MYNSGHLQWDGKRNSSYNHDSLSLLQRHLIALTVLCSTSIHQVTFLLYWFCFQRVISRLITIAKGPSSQLVLASMGARSQLFEHQRLVFQYVELTWPCCLYPAAVQPVPLNTLLCSWYLYNCTPCPFQYSSSQLIVDTCVSFRTAVPHSCSCSLCYFATLLLCCLSFVTLQDGSEY